MEEHPSTTFSASWQLSPHAYSGTTTGWDGNGDRATVASKIITISIAIPVTFQLEVIEDSPAYLQGLRAQDIFIRFGELTLEKFEGKGSNLAIIAEMAEQSFYKPLKCMVLRNERVYDIELQVCVSKEIGDGDGNEQGNVVGDGDGV